MKKKWNPYLAGALVGILALLSVAVSEKVLSKPKYLGTSTSFVRAAGFIEKLIAKQHVDNNEYFTEEKVKVDWQMMFVLGIFFGALISSVLGKTYKSQLVPPIWKERFGDSFALRAVGAFAGGLVALFGVRLAGGCPSGHGLSGMMQLSLSGLIAMICFIIGGIITAALIYKGGK